MEFLSHDALKQAAPSIFATAPWGGVSSKYAFIPTIDVVEALAAEGFLPVKATQSVSRIEGKFGFAKHAIRFRREADLIARPRVVNGNAHHFYAEADQPIIPELCLTNAHDLTSTFILDAGFWRQLCSNGLMVCSSMFSSVRTRHSGDVSNILEGAYTIVNEFPKALEQIDAWGKIELKPEQQRAYAVAAAELRWGDTTPVDPSKLLTVRRSGDRSNDVFTTFNRVQEAIIKGGVRGYGAKGRRMTSRAVKGVSEDNRLNKALWRLTEELAKAVA
jgi:hypothetical protein